MNTFIKTQDEIIALSGASIALSVKRLTPYLTLSRAEKEIRRILTDDLFDSLLAMYDDGTIADPGNEHAQAILPYVQKPLLLLAIYDFLLEGHATVSDGGIQVANRDKAAFRWQQEELKASYIEKAYLAMDDLIKYLNRNKVDFADWEASSAYTLTREFFINDPDTFQRWVNIRESYRMLVVLKPSMRNLEESKFKELLTPTLYADIKDGIKSDDLTPEETALLKFIEPAIAFLSMADAIETMHIELTADGGYVKSLAKTETSNLETQAAKDAQLRSYYDKLRQKGDMWVNDLNVYLNANASAQKYASYFESTNYKNPEVAATPIDTTRQSINLMNGG